MAAIGSTCAHVNIDMTTVEFTDSRALSNPVRALLVTLLDEGPVRLVAVSDAARIIVELTQLDSVFPVRAERYHLIRAEVCRRGGCARCEGTCDYDVVPSTPAPFTSPKVGGVHFTQRG